MNLQPYGISFSLPHANWLPLRPENIKSPFKTGIKQPTDVKK
jgi:hypothetical protein